MGAWLCELLFNCFSHDLNTLMIKTSCAKRWGLKDLQRFYRPVMLQDCSIMTHPPHVALERDGDGPNKVPESVCMLYHRDRLGALGDHPCTPELSF